MAYISKEQAKEIRQKVKEAFPSKEGWKFSITVEHYTSLRVIIREAPIELIPDTIDYQQINHYQLDNNVFREDINDIYKKITDICMEGNHDNSDPYTDYFDVGWYYTLQVGEWDRPFKVSLAIIK